jgi:hypothetical protein
MTRRVTTPEDDQAMIALAKAGHFTATIAKRFGCSQSTVSRRTKGMNPYTGARGNAARREQILADVDATPPGQRHHLVERYGFDSLISFNTMVCRHRKRLAFPASSSEERSSVGNG